MRYWKIIFDSLARLLEIINIKKVKYQYINMFGLQAKISLFPQFYPFLNSKIN